MDTLVELHTVALQDIPCQVLLRSIFGHGVLNLRPIARGLSPYCHLSSETEFRLSEFCKVACRLSESCKGDPQWRQALWRGTRHTNRSDAVASKDESRSFCWIKFNWPVPHGRPAYCSAAVLPRAPGRSACRSSRKAPCMCVAGPRLRANSLRRHHGTTWA